MRLLALLFCLASLRAGEPLVIGLVAEMSHGTSTSGQAIERGLRLAIGAINAGGGVLGGRQLRLEIRDSRSIPARGVAELRDLAGRPEVVAVVGGKFSPVVLESLPAIHELRMPYLLPWSAADGIIDHAHRPSYTFRLSLRDSWAMPALLQRARTRGFASVGLLAVNNAWGRSGQAALRQAVERADGGIALAGVEWFPTGADDMLPPWRRLLASGADAVILAANEGEATQLVRQLAGAPADQLRPLLCHWGLTGGDFVAMCGPALAAVDLVVVQTFLFDDAAGGEAGRLLATLRGDGVPDPARLPSAVGLAHAWDLVHLLARAIAAAGSADRSAIRDALERLEPWDGAVRRYAPAFTAERHEALSPEQVRIARFDANGRLVAER